MDRYEQFRRAATDRDIPNEEIEKFADQLRFALWIGTARQDDQVVGQFGGVPRLPLGAEWPTSRDGALLPFIASVDCALLPRAEGLALPDDGSLLFFLHHEEDHLARLSTDVQEFARAVYVPAGAETAPAALPPGYDTRKYSHEYLPFVSPEHPLTASVRPELPEWIEEDDHEFDSDVLEHLFTELKHVDELCGLVDELWPGDDRGAGLRIGGYCSEIGGEDPPRTKLRYAGFGSGPLDFPDAERFSSSELQEYQVVREWVPLAQFYTASDYYYGCFMINSADLAARQFDKMISFTMFTE